MSKSSTPNTPQMVYAILSLVLLIVAALSALILGLIYASVWPPVVKLGVVAALLTVALAEGALYLRGRRILAQRQRRNAEQVAAELVEFVNVNCEVLGVPPLTAEQGEAVRGAVQAELEQRATRRLD